MINEGFQCSAEGGDHKSSQMALIIDVQLDCVACMEEADAEVYLDRLGQEIEDLRRRHIPVTWVTMTERDELHRPVNDHGVAPMTGEDYVALGFLSSANEMDQYRNVEVFQQFLEKHGPKTNEAVYCKNRKGAFSNPVNEALDNSFGEYVQSKNIQNPLVMGMVSTHCVVETAIGGSLHGFQPTICSDLVVSWKDHGERRGDSSRTIWKDGDTVLHNSKIQDKLLWMQSGETGVSEYSAQQVAEAVPYISFSTYSDAVSMGQSNQANGFQL